MELHSVDLGQAQGLPVEDAGIVPGVGRGGNHDGGGDHLRPPDPGGA